MAREVGADQVIRDLGRFALLAAHTAGEQIGDGAQSVRWKSRHGEDLAGVG